MAGIWYSLISVGRTGGGGLICAYWTIMWINAIFVCVEEMRYLRDLAELEWVSYSSHTIDQWTNSHRTEPCRASPFVDPTWRSGTLIRTSLVLTISFVQHFLGQPASGILFIGFSSILKDIRIYKYIYLRLEHLSSLMFRHRRIAVAPIPRIFLFQRIICTVERSLISITRTIGISTVKRRRNSWLQCYSRFLRFPVHRLLVTLIGFAFVLFHLFDSQFFRNFEWFR